MVMMPPFPSFRLHDWQRDPDLFALAMDGVEVCDERPWRVRFRGVASGRVPRMVEALQFNRQPETLGELIALMGYGGMLHEALMRLDAQPESERAAAITQEVMRATTEFPADHGAAMLAYLQGDLVALSVIHGNYYGLLVSSMGNAVEEAVRWFLANAAEVRPPPVLQ